MRKRNTLRRIAMLALTVAMLLSLTTVAFATTNDAVLDREWTKDQKFVLAEPAPQNLTELKQVVDVQDPRSVAAYFVWAVNRLVDDYDDGMAMMKYLFADIDPFGSGFYEGGLSGKAGWDSYFNERLDDPYYMWLPRAYFDGGSISNNFTPTKPLTLELYYNSTNTETINEQTFETLGRLNIVYWVMSYAGGNQVNITVSKFAESDRWYVTSGTTSAALFYDQNSAITPDAEFAGGTGTEKDPYLISTKEHLNNVRNYLGAYFKMTADIVFTDDDFAQGGAFYNGGAGWAPIGNDSKPFRGVFDGDGHTITGLYQNISASSDVYGGLFGYANGAAIKNLGMVDSDIYVKETHDSYVGGIAGISDNSTIADCSNSGTVRVAYPGKYCVTLVGGIVGKSSNSAIIDCINSGTVSTSYSSVCAGTGGIAGGSSGDSITNCTNMGTVRSNANGFPETGGIVGSSDNGTNITNCYNIGAVSITYYDTLSYAGGIVGKGCDTNITNCYNMGTISASSSHDYVGGIIGSSVGGINIENCYNIGKVNATSIYSARSGGIVGNCDKGNNIINCYNMGEVTACCREPNCFADLGGVVGYNIGSVTNCYYLNENREFTNEEGTACTADEMKQQSTFVGFDFTNIWTMDGNASYPYPELRDVQHVIPVLVTITEQPEDVTADVGVSVKFSIMVEGEAASYQWQYRTSANGTWANTTLTGSKTATLSVSATTARNGYQYRCVITDSKGTKLYSNAATLTVNAKLVITQQPASVTAELNDSVKFTVKASGSGLKYQWQYRTSASGTWANTTLTGSKTATLSVSATTARNGYQYRCVITDANGNKVTSNAATLTVNAKLAITTQPASVTAELNDSVKFTVKASGSGLKYQWQYRSSANGTWANTTLTGCKTATISVSATTARNGYQYRCVITDAAGNKVTSNAATLTVNAKLAITTQPKSVTANLNDTVKFTVKASGSGLKYQWQYRTSSGGTWKTTTLTGSKTATLSATATAARNGYQYRCVITDASGNKVTSNAATLTVNAKLAITTQPKSVTANLNDAVKFTVKASGSGLKYQWQYRTSASGTWKTTTLTGSKTATLSATATTARNGYQYRCVITDANGNKVTSNAAILTVVNP